MGIVTEQKLRRKKVEEDVVSYINFWVPVRGEKKCNPPSAGPPFVFISFFFSSVESGGRSAAIHPTSCTFCLHGDGHSSSLTHSRRQTFGPWSQLLAENNSQLLAQHLRRPRLMVMWEPCHLRRYFVGVGQPAGRAAGKACSLSPGRKELSTSGPEPEPFRLVSLLSVKVYLRPGLSACLFAHSRA